MIGWLRSLFAWRTVEDTGVWRYQQNAVTGRRRLLRVGPGLQPVARQWLEGGPLKPPRGRPPHGGRAGRGR